MHAIVELLKQLPAELVTLLVAMIPIAELRGAIPVGVSMGLSLPKAYFFAVLGNLIPVVPLLLFLDPVADYLRRFKFWRGFFEWLFERTEAKAAVVRRYEAIGLALFVMVPLPITGAWTGCAAASLFKLRFRTAFPAISIGIFSAGILVSLAVHYGIELFYKSL